MPVNYTPEYLAAERKYLQARTKEDRILALEEMIRLCPKHKGASNVLAQLHARLAKLKREAEAQRKQKKGGKKAGISKEGEAQACLLGFTMSGKSTILSKLTEARPEIAEHEYTTTMPAVGMMDWSGVKVQLVEVPATFDPVYLSMCRSADLVVLVVKDDSEKKQLEELMKDRFIRTRSIAVNPHKEDIGDIRKKIWHALNLIIVYTKRKGQISPMALPAESTVRDFCMRIHKDFVKDFRFAFLWRGGRRAQVGLEYKLQEGDVVEVHTG
jgi:hypothetical protein